MIDSEKIARIADEVGVTPEQVRDVVAFDAGFTAGLTWATVKPAAFDADAPDVQEALFAAPDACGTLDLFGDAL